MVRLNKITTRAGDDGRTALGDGTRVPKTDARIEAYGTVDELNAVVGLCLEHAGPEQAARLTALQHDLFDLGADLCVPRAPDEPPGRLRLQPAAVDRLEGWMEVVNQSLPELTSFVLPGGGPLAAHLHLARTVCRRAERRVVRLAEAETDRVNPVATVYLNRLSDLFFVLARAAAGEAERLWTPGGGGTP